MFDLIRVNSALPDGSWVKCSPLQPRAIFFLPGSRPHPTLPMDGDYSETRVTASQRHITQADAASRERRPCANLNRAHQPWFRSRFQNSREWFGSTMCASS